jgi:hypothetical protein
LRKEKKKVVGKGEDRVVRTLEQGIFRGSIQIIDNDTNSTGDEPDLTNKTSSESVGQFDDEKNGYLCDKTDDRTTLMRSTLKIQQKLIDGLVNVAHELDDNDVENEKIETLDDHPFIAMFSFKVATKRLFQPNSEIKYGTKSDLEALNPVYFILTVWGLAISTPYYLLSAPLFNVWRFLVLFGHYLVVAVFSGHCVPELIIILSCILGFIYLESKYKEVQYSILNFAKQAGIILLKKYVKFAVFTLVAIAFTLYISPFLGSGPNYYASGISYNSCYNDWWWNLLMIGNFGPTSFYGMGGCLPWIWILSGIFQFWLCIPPILILYRKSKIATYLFLFLISAGSIAYTMYLVYKYDFKVGVLAFENLQDNVFDRVICSPLTKFHLLLMSFAFSRFYLAIQDHKAKPEVEQSWVMKKIYNRDSWIFTGALYGVMFSVFLVYLLIGRSALKNPYLWTRWENTLFYGFAKFMIFFVLLFLLFILYTENSPMIKKLFMIDYFSAISKLSFCVFLIYPTVIFFLYARGTNAFFISYPTIVYAFVHHFVISFAISLCITMAFLIPLFNIIHKLKIIIT